MSVSRKDPEKISSPSATNTATATGGSFANVGDISGSTIHLQTAQNVGNLSEFRDQLELFRRELRQADLEPTLAQDLEKEAQDVQEQIEREKPNFSMIEGKVKTITGVLAAATGAAEKLKPMAEMLGRLLAPWV